MKEFSAQTRAKLSAAMKARWARVAAERAERAARESETSLMSLYAAAAALIEDDELREAIVDCAETRTIVAALEAETMEGTNLQKRLRNVLIAQIAKAIGKDD
jgi:hypothetical protein